MLKYIYEWIKDCNAVTKELNEMGYFTLSNWFGSYTYVDKEMYKEYWEKREREIERNLDQNNRVRTKNNR